MWINILLFNYMEIIIINANQAEKLMWRVSITHKHIKSCLYYSQPVIWFIIALLIFIAQLALWMLSSLVWLLVNSPIHPLSSFFFNVCPHDATALVNPLSSAHMLSTDHCGNL